MQVRRLFGVQHFDFSAMIPCQFFTLSPSGMHVCRFRALDVAMRTRMCFHRYYWIRAQRYKQEYGLASEWQAFHPSFSTCVCTVCVPVSLHMSMCVFMFIAEMLFNQFARKFVLLPRTYFRMHVNACVSPSLSTLPPSPHARLPLPLAQPILFVYPLRPSGCP